MVVAGKSAMEGVEDRKRKREVPLILVDEGLCKRCGICIAFCPTKVYDTREDGLPIVARREDCIWCGLCEVRCPDFAILLKGEGEDDDGGEGGEPPPRRIEAAPVGGGGTRGAQSAAQNSEKASGGVGQ